MENGYISRSYMKMSPQDRRTFDRWLKANAILGFIFAVGIVAMSVAGFNSGGPRDAAVAENTRTSDVVASEQRRLRNRSAERTRGFAHGALENTP
jgi:hypothetical protein